MLNGTPLLRLYAQRRLRQLDKQRPEAVQRAQLRSLLKRAENTRFGKDHGFASIHDVEAYQCKVPVRSYDALWRDYWSKPFPHLTDCTWPGRIKYFATTSGTTSDRTKYIPASKALISSNAKGGFDLFTHHLINNPDSQVFGGKGFFFGGFKDPEEVAPGIFAGLMSSIMYEKNLPPWAKPLYFLETRRLKAIPDWRERVRQLAAESVKRDIRSISSFPSLLPIFFEALVREGSYDSAFRIRDYFPKLELIAHGGVSATPYREQLSQAVQDSRCDLREIYSCSEGFLGVADRGWDEGMRLILDHGIFYEFVPLETLDQENPVRRWIGDVETGVDYAIILTTCAGLWSYVLGDIVEFVDLAPPRLKIKGRIGSTLSIYGEKVSDRELEHAVRVAAEETQAVIGEFSVGAIYPGQDNARGRHCFMIEFIELPRVEEGLKQFSTTLDRTLCEINLFYERIHFDGGGGLEPPEIVAVPPKIFHQWVMHKGKGPGKIPRVMSDERFAEFSAFIARQQSR